MIKNDDVRLGLPPVATPEAWQAARDELLRLEKEATRTLDALAARRRRLPMTRVDKEYTFDAPGGRRTLLDLFDGHHQLLAYQFMDNGPDDYCPGCTAFANNIPGVGADRLGRRGVALALISDMPLAQIQEYKARMGWTVPFVSSHGSTFAADCGAHGGFMLSAFLRDGAEVYRTYNTTQRGADRLIWVHNMLDLTVYGRQEVWEDSPEGWPRAY